VTVSDGLDADAVGLVVFFAGCFAQNVVYSLRWVDCEAENAVDLWWIPLRCAAEAVGNVVRLAFLMRGQGRG
jgi:hypothetical protein